MLQFPFMLATSNTKSLILLSVDEFSKMKDGVPPHIMDEHIKSYKQAVKEGKTTDPRFGLEKTLIAGAGRLSLFSMENNHKTVKLVRLICRWVT